MPCCTAWLVCNLVCKLHLSLEDYSGITLIVAVPGTGPGIATGLDAAGCGGAGWKAAIPSEDCEAGSAGATASRVGTGTAGVVD
jgi:hypothetical protein